MYEYVAPPLLLASHIKDERITVGNYTFFSGKITFGIWRPEERVVFGKFCTLAEDITVFGGGEHIISRVTTYPFRHFLSDSEPSQKNAESTSKGKTTIGNDVWVGYGATILSGVTIGNGAVIGARAVVTKDIPDYAIAVGNPAKVIRYRFRSETIKRLLELRWWDWSFPKIVTNLDLLYQNPDNWTQDIQFKEAQGESPNFYDPLLARMSQGKIKDAEKTEPFLSQSS